MQLTRKQWIEQLRPGRRLVCTFRWYWGRDKEPPPDSREECQIIEARTTQAIMKTPTTERSWMHYPRASELKATDTGFELFFPTEPKWGERSGILMSRYEWVRDGQ